MLRQAFYPIHQQHPVDISDIQTSEFEYQQKKDRAKQGSHEEQARQPAGSFLYKHCYILPKMKYARLLNGGKQDTQRFNNTQSFIITNILLKFT